MLQIFQTLTGYGGDSNHLQLVLSTPAFELFYLIGISGVHLCRNHDRRLLRQLWIVLKEFGANCFEFVYGIRFAQSRNVNQMQQDAASFDMAQKLDAKTVTFVRSFDQT